MEQKSKRRLEEGVVVSNKMEKTVRVSIVRTVMHPLYKKYVRRTTKIMAHDEKKECAPGDTVEIKEVRPISKNKKWMVVRVLKKAAAGQMEEIKDGSELS
ncbi:MAG TPA: 30S ribosomal protein S17 [bacterium]|nr:30S ribosomal protein S17 [bacterium]